MIRLTSPWSSTGLFVLAALIVNALIFGLGLQAHNEPGDPPGWLVGSVWLALFACFGVAHWRLRSEGPEFFRARLGIEAFACLCLIYPLYTLGLGSRSIGLAGNGLTAFAAIVLAWRVWPLERAAAGLLLPVLPWLAFASWTIVNPA